MESTRVLFILCVACVFSVRGDLDNQDENWPEGFAGKPPPFSPFPQQNFSSAVVSLNSGGNGIYGGITFVSFGGVTYIQGVIANLSNGVHGLHIHSSGKVWNNCKLIGDHYNPYNRNHSCDAATGHLGDLGNVESVNGLAYVNKTVSGMTLAWSDGKEGNGNPGVLGLSLAVDTTFDTCKEENDGNSGAPLACGSILPLFGPRSR